MGVQLKNIFRMLVGVFAFTNMAMAAPAYVCIDDVYLYQVNAGSSKLLTNTRLVDPALGNDHASYCEALANVINVATSRMKFPNEKISFRCDKYPETSGRPTYGLFLVSTKEKSAVGSEKDFANRIFREVNLNECSKIANELNKTI
jgi:hypothetical protein